MAIGETAIGIMGVVERGVMASVQTPSQVDSSVCAPVPTRDPGDCRSDHFSNSESIQPHLTR